MEFKVRIFNLFGRISFKFTIYADLLINLLMI